jgi:hypothetical protein
MALYRFLIRSPIVLAAAADNTSPHRLAVFEESSFREAEAGRTVTDSAGLTCWTLQWSTMIVESMRNTVKPGASDIKVHLQEQLFVGALDLSLSVRCYAWFAAGRNCCILGPSLWQLCVVRSMRARVRIDQTQRFDLSISGYRRLGRTSHTSLGLAIGVDCSVARSARRHCILRAVAPTFEGCITRKQAIQLETTVTPLIVYFPKVLVHRAGDYIAIYILSWRGE